MSGTGQDSSGSKQQQQQQQRAASLGRQLSAAVSGRRPPIDPALLSVLRAAPHHQHRPSITFAARAAIDPDNPAASLEMFRRLSRSSGSSSSGHERPGRRADGDSAHAEGSVSRLSSGGSSLLDLLDDGWSGGTHKSGAAQPGSSRGASAFAAVAGASAPPSLSSAQSSRVASPQPEPQPKSLRGQVPPPPALCVGSPEPPPSLGGPSSVATPTESTSSATADSLAFVSITPAAQEGAGASLQEEHPAGGPDMPRSAVSWTSMMTLPQTEADLLQLDMRDIEQLAAEAAELEKRAATALRLARQRMQGSGGVQASGGGMAGGSSVEVLESYVPGVVYRPSGRSSGGAGGQVPADDTASEEVVAAAKPAAAAEVVPTPQPKPTSRQPVLHLALQLCMVLLAMAQVVLLAAAGLVRGVSRGIVQLPPGLVLAPVIVGRAAVVVLFLFLDLLLQLPAVVLRTHHAMRATSLSGSTA